MRPALREAGAVLFGPHGTNPAPGAILGPPEQFWGWGECTEHTDRLRHAPALSAARSWAARRLVARFALMVN